MERTHLESWITHHPGSIHADSIALLDQGEHDALDHAHRDAWTQAQKIAQKSLRGFQGSSGYPASDTFVAREVCRELARELKLHEPMPNDPTRSEEEWVSRSLLDSLEPEAQRMFVEWIHEMAAKEEHSTWMEIVRFTDHRAKALIQERHLTDQCDWDLDHRYSLVATRVLKMLIADFEAHNQ
jgi:hypothetical protein